MRESGIPIIFALVIFSITQTYSAPPVKPPKTVDLPGKNFMKIDFPKENNPKELRDEVVTDPQKYTVETAFRMENLQTETLPGEQGYFPPEIAGPSRPKPSDSYVDNEEKATGFSQAFHFSNFESSFKMKRKYTSSERSGQIDTNINPEIRIKVTDTSKPIVKSQKAGESSQQGFINRGPVSENLINHQHLHNFVPEQIFYSSGTVPFKIIDVPRDIKANPNLYEKWFVENLPEHGTYQEVFQSNYDRAASLKSIEFSKLMIMKQNYATYGFIAPEKIRVNVDTKHGYYVGVPKDAKENQARYSMWLERTLPKSGFYQEIYGSGASSELMAIERPQTIVGNTLNVPAEGFFKQKNFLSRFSDEIKSRMNERKNYHLLKEEIPGRSEVMNYGATGSHERTIVSIAEEKENTDKARNEKGNVNPANSLFET